jgi:glycine/D-amino acid oxidase-like deaminating enzyme
LLQSSCLLEDFFNIDELIVNENNVEYKNIIANKIIFCDGVEGANNKWFKQLPFAPNKGEALIVKIPNLPNNNIYKSGISIVPWSNNLFWVGSSYEWNFTNAKPTTIFKQKTTTALNNILKIPYKIVDHISAVRPANIERRPFVGLHPIQKNIGIFNGMGTKGCSLAPYFANEFVEYLLHKKTLNPLVDINRFEKILSR